MCWKNPHLYFVRSHAAFVQVVFFQFKLCVMNKINSKITITKSKKVRYILSLLLVFLFNNQAFSQFKIKGKILDERNNPIEFLEIQLKNKDSIISTSELTNEEGEYLLNSREGEYTLLVRQMGDIYL